MRIKKSHALAVIILDSLNVSESPITLAYFLLISEIDCFLDPITLESALMTIVTLQRAVHLLAISAISALCLCQLYTSAPCHAAPPISISAELGCQESGGSWNACASACRPISCLDSEGEVMTLEVEEDEDCPLVCVELCDCPEGLAFDGSSCVRSEWALPECDTLNDQSDHEGLMGEDGDLMDEDEEVEDVLWLEGDDLCEDGYWGDGDEDEYAYEAQYRCDEGEEWSEDQVRSTCALYGGYMVCVNDHLETELTIEGEDGSCQLRCVCSEWEVMTDDGRCLSHRDYLQERRERRAQDRFLDDLFAGGCDVHTHGRHRTPLSSALFSILILLVGLKFRKSLSS